jgi:hypothetical protein
MILRVSVLTLIVGVALAVPTRAEKAPLSPEQLKKTATHVITGDVTAIYTRTETAGDWQYTRYVAELRVAECEKGDGVKKGDLVYARYWHRQWISPRKQEPNTNGHYDLPKQGETVRIYMAKNAYDGFTFDNKDGGFNVIGANGFENVKPARK